MNSPTAPKPCPDLHAPPLQAVRLLPGPILDRQRRNTQYLLELDPDRLLHNFRVQAGLPSAADPLGGWEAPGCGLRGHFVGHYLSACAQGWAATGDARLLERVETLVAALSACQRAGGDGYLSAFPRSDLDAIETRFEGAWASYYVLHKILAGLIDAYALCNVDEALAVAKRLADYIAARLAKLSAEQIEGMCRTDLKPNPTNEFGGIGESLQDLAALTGDARYDDASRVFDRDWFIQPLLNRQDRLTGLHANTHIPLVLSLARRFERTGDTRLRDAVAYFWDLTATARSFVNGGSSGPRPDHAEKSTGGEHWSEAHKLAGTLTPKNNESCVTHNMLRLTDFLFRWTEDPRYADFYERAYFNHVLAMQHPGHTGGYLYDHPLAPASVKKFGHALDAFWCCYGSSVEAYERLGHGIYYLGDDELFVNLLVPSELRWEGRDLTLTQQTGFPGEAATQLRIRGGQPSEFTVAVRIPHGCAAAGITVNDGPAAAAEAPFARIRRTWRDGDVVTLRFSMTLSAETMPDDPAMLAFRYGPLVLAARSDADLVLPHRDLTSAVASVRPLDRAATFAITLANGKAVELIPLNQIVDEPFGVYFHLR